MDFSSIVNEAIKTILSQLFFFFFFLQKEMEHKKRQTKPKPTNKNLKKRTKNNRGNFLQIETSEGVKITYFAL